MAGDEQHMPMAASDRSRGVAVALAAVLGPFGAHRFYAGRVGSGVLMACTLGGLGIWYLYDLILVSAGAFRDAEGRLVSRWEVDPGAQPQVDSMVLDELDALRREVAELSERVDFTERLLASPRRETGSPPARPDGGDAYG